MPSRGYWDFALGLISALLAGAGIAASLAVLHEQRQLVAASQYNSVFDITQTATQAMRMEAELAAFRLPDSGIREPDIRLRAELLANHLNVLRQGEARELLSAQPTTAATLASIETVTNAARAGLSPGEAGMRFDQLRSLNGNIARMTSIAHEHAGDVVHRFQSTLSNAYWFMFLVMVGMVGSGFALVALLVVRNRRALRDAFTDALTGLPNRRAFTTLLETSLQLPDDAEVAILLLDLDMFKSVNDTLGHGAGDEVLKELGARLKSAGEDACVVARLGGDEFAMVLSGPRVLPRAKSLATHLLADMVHPVWAAGRSIALGISIGIAVAGRAAAKGSAQELLSQADLALYAAKAEGRGRQRVFTPDLLERQLHRQQIEQDLRAALVRQQFELWFQPIVDLATGTVVSSEALIRWRHPERGLVSPAEFIPILEDTGLIEEVGTWVLDEACRRAVTWPLPIRVSVNTSLRQFEDGRIAGKVARALGRSGLPADRLEIEITESMLARDEGEVAAALQAMHQAGSRIALDDFGTGYASMSYIDRLPFDKIKIDQSFVRSLSSRAASAAVVQAIAVLADRLDIAVCAEGIETEDQLAQLRQVVCQEGQGYLFAHPMPPQDFLALLERIAGRGALLAHPPAVRHLRIA